MRRSFAIPILLLALIAAMAAFASRRQEPVRLAVIVVVDQLRADMLDRYDDLFTGGFRRLREEGFRFTDATHDHWWTETAPGHTAIATGMYPTHNGIVQNDHFLRDADRVRAEYSFADPSSPIPGSELPGRSPANLRVPGFADWLVDHEPRARVVTLSRKDRGAIPLAGRTHGTALWVDIEAGRFVTSEYYAREFPAWLDDFNTNLMPVLYSDSVWTLRVPADAVSRARRDSADYENGGRDVTFPHAASERPANQSYNAWMAETPAPDLATMLLARRAAEELQLGRQDHIDYLGISLSQTDAIGHNWGPLSLEQLDNLLRIDRILGQFMTFLDESVGRGRWLLALSADHGIMTAPEYLREQGIGARRLSGTELRGSRAILAGLADAADAEARARVIAQAEALPFVADVVTEDELQNRTESADSFIRLLRNAYIPDRSSSSLLRQGVVVRNEEYAISGRSDAATHGSPYYYDRHVPLVFMGPGVSPGTSGDRARTVDLAPTLAALLGLPAPDGLDGVSLVPALRR